MKTLRFELDGSWVFQHRDDATLPVQSIIEKLGLGDDIKVSASLTGAEFECKDEKVLEGLTQRIKDAFVSSYPNDDMAAVLTIEDGEVEDEDIDVDEMLREARAEAVAAQEEAAGRRKSSRAAEASETADAGASKKSALEEIDALVGAEEFKALAHEVATVLPEIIKNKTQEVFICQSYLFAINDGCGLSMYLSKLAKLIGETKLAKFQGDFVIEEKLAPLKDVRDTAEPFECVTKKLKSNYSPALRIMSIDISEWMDKTDGKPFKDFLRTVTSSMGEFIFVFRVPYLEKTVLDKIQASLNDLLFIRTVAVAPFTSDELKAAAEMSLTQFGFKMTKSAWAGFDKRITEEKSDGKFYGLNTVNKVVRELLYKKQLSGAQHGKASKTINATDTAAICLGDNAPEKSGYDMLLGLVGSDTLKARVDEIVAQVTMALKSDDIDTPCLHMRFVGNPGTGKTTVARIIGKIFKEKGILRVGNFYEYSGRDFCGRYVGETAPKTSSMCRDAYGSVLFIDEAYSLYRGNGESNDFGREALDTLIAEMENHRSDLVVIMAGYQDDMKKLMDGNVGLMSRMPYTIEFPNFSREELYEIFVQLTQKFECEDKVLTAAHEYFTNLSDDFLGAKDFSNARFVRNLFERTWAKAVTRCQLEKVKTVTIKKDDFDRAIMEKDFDLTVKKKARIGF